MQTFLPYPSFKQSAECLDTKRLGKQRVEVLQILNALSGQSKGWVNHPATLMWKGYTYSLAAYGQYCIDEWVKRGYSNSIALDEWLYTAHMDNPPWLGDPRLHDSHKSNLLRKFPEYYSRYGWDVPNDIPYYWPTN